MPFWQNYSDTSGENACVVVAVGASALAYVEITQKSLRMLNELVPE